MAEKKGFTLEDILEEQRARQNEGPAEQIPPEQSPQAQEEVPEEAAPVGVSDDTADLNAFATGNFPVQGQEKKKKKRSWFGRKKKVPDFDEGEDMYYGVQLKPIDEYRKGYDPATGEFTLNGNNTYQDLFDDSKQAIDDEVEQNFQRLQKERRRRVAEAVQSAGVDEEQIADEFGVVAPMPVTAFAADPYARQHGIEVEGEGEVHDIQKAMMESSHTMEIKLNVANDTVELQRVKEMPAVSEESINKILKSAEQDRQDPQPEQEVPEPTEVQLAEDGRAAPEGQAPDREEVITGRPTEEIPQVASIYEYRSRGIPTHVINADVLQSALLSESEELRDRPSSEEEGGYSGQRLSRSRRPDEVPEIEDISSGQDIGESIDDYTGQEDARSIANELRGDMRELTMRMAITGVCTVLLALANIIFGGIISGRSDPGSMPIVYVMLTVVFLLVSVGVCYRTVFNGLKALFSFNANSDSAVAVAAVAVAIQTVGSIFFRSELADGKLHLYAVILSALLFVNAAGKLTMIRRIHSNFRFITSREQKYCVRTYDDYNTALKMVKDRVAEKPSVAYQCKANFLRRFLELSYDPDPSEAASQSLAPIGLIASLVVCIVCMLITKSVPTALSALAAASCACVAAANMLSVNLPVSRLCRTARRAGAMVVGYDAVEQLGNVNAVLVDAEELFPRGTVVLNGIKTFGNRAGAESAIIAASALMKEVGGPLAGVFDQVISENEDALPEVESCTYEDEGGIVGRVGDQKIYIGNRALLINHRIDVPSREEESQYATGNKLVIYIAVDTAVAAMLVLTYSADRRRKNELQRLENSGISVLIRTTDPNVTSQMIARLFGVDNGSVGVLEGELNEVAGRLTGDTVSRADAVVATKGRMESMMNVISACVEEKRTAAMVVAIQNAAVIIGFVLVAFMACFGGMRQLSSFVLFAFETFWLLVLLVLPKLRK